AWRATLQRSRARRARIFGRATRRSSELLRDQANRPHRVRVRIERIAVGSAEHAAALELRVDVLRRPIALPGISSAERAAEPKSVHFACLDGARIVGTLLLVEEGPAVLRMRQVAVAPDAQGRGVGTLLVRSAEQYCAERGIEKLTAHARAPVVPFYERL